MLNVLDEQDSVSDISLNTDISNIGITLGAYLLVLEKLYLVMKLTLRMLLTKV